jgi:hypothetical protein
MDFLSLLGNKQDKYKQNILLQNMASFIFLLNTTKQDGLFLLNTTKQYGSNKIWFTQIRQL